MLLKSLKLENIRSYSNQRIDFSDGSLLLAGDIGSGKSTILLAIEFALFGIKHGELTGGALLRHGAKEGSVELVLDIMGKEIIVKRTLKRGKERIGQGAGYVVENGVKSDMMPKEIRAKVYGLLAYPKSLVSKGQDLIYRFTVYTPQEQMKRIIYEDKDSRLDTLRKVFNIDKYKTIRENALKYVRWLKDKRHNYEGRVSDLQEKKRQKEDLAKGLAEIRVKDKGLDEELKKAIESTKSKKERIKALEEKIKAFNDIKREASVLDVDLRNVLEKREKEKKEMEGLQEQILKLREELKDFKDERKLQGILEDKERRVETLEKELVDIRRKKDEIKGKINHIKDDAEKVKKLDDCPLCMQNVPHSHKESIVAKANENINSLKDRFEVLGKNEADLISNRDIFNREVREFRERISLSKVLVQKKAVMMEKQERLSLLKDSFESAKKNVASINAKKMELGEKIKSFEGLDSDYEKAKAEYDKELAVQNNLSVEKGKLRGEIEGISKQIELVSKEIDEKENVKRALKRLVELQNFLEGKFVKLVVNIEKHVLLTVYHEFNELFKRWFSVLIEDENMGAGLDDSFSVVVEQNGYETTIENLSGGEKTCVALAYRLALNKVINDVVSSIKTKDILILDEPTEGFSTAQLDRVRDVLEQIGIRQIIIVSHESKIESFVDNVVRIRKEEGVSLVG